MAAVDFFIGGDLMTGIHTYIDLRGAQDHARRGVKYALGCGGTLSSPVCVKQRMQLKRKPHAQACWGAHPLAMTRMVVQRPKWASGREAGESYGKTSFLPVL